MDVRTLRVLPMTELADRSVGAPDAPWQTATPRRGGTKLRFHLPALRAVPLTRTLKGVGKRQFHRLLAGGVAGVGRPGAPALPAASRLVPVPDGKRVVIDVNALQVRVFEGITPEPSQAHVLDTRTRQPYAFDEAAYGHRGQPWATVSEPFLLGDRRVARVSVTHARMADGGLEVAGIVEVGIRYEAVPLDLGDLAIYDKDGPVFLIVHSAALAAPAARLARWKNRRGLKTACVEVSTLGADATALKAALRFRRLTSPLRYVLLMGDVDAVPTNYVGGTATDQPYAEAADYADDHEFAPRLAIGRVTARTVAEADAVVSKVILYERNPPANCDYYQRAVVAGLFQDDDADGQTDRGYIRTVERVRSHLVDLGYDVQRVYVTDNDTPLRLDDGTELSADQKAAFITEADATERLVRAANEGQLVFVHRDHGSASGWWKPSLDRGDLDRFQELVPSNFFSINCSTGRFDAADASESFAEKLLRLDGGVPTLIAATRDTSSDLNNHLTLGICDALWPGMLPDWPGEDVAWPVDSRRIGDVLNYGKAYAAKVYATAPTHARTHALQYHVVGDPTLEIWTSKPSCVELTASERNGTLTMRLAAVPVGSTLTIWHGDTQLARLEPTNVVTTWSVPFFLRAGEDVELEVCFKAPGHLFASRRVGVGQLRIRGVLPELAAREVRIWEAAVRARR